MNDKEDSGLSGQDYVHQVIFIIVVLMLLGSLFEGTGYINLIGAEIDKNEGTPTFVGSFFPVGDIRVGDRVANKGEVVVRQEPGGDILGLQPAWVKGEVISGPVNKFSKKWWRMDYEDAPDGWVWNGNLTVYTTVFAILSIIPTTIEILTPFLIFLSVIILILISWVFLKMHDLRQIEKKKGEFLEEQERVKHRDDVAEDSGEVSEIEIDNLPTGSGAPKTEDVHNRRWANVQSLIHSHSVNDWKQAILEADAILDEMLDKIGYKGDSMGDKLKTIERSDFLTLDKAWEAHKIRNTIAHKGSDYVLSRDVAENAIELYKQVFTEFYYI